MARKKYKSGGAGRYGRPKSGVCSMCGRVHPRGRNQKAAARKKGWESCASVYNRKKLALSS